MPRPNRRRTSRKLKTRSVVAQTPPQPGCFRNAHNGGSPDRIREARRKPPAAAPHLRRQQQREVLPTACHEGSLQSFAAAGRAAYNVAQAQALGFLVTTSCYCTTHPFCKHSVQIPSQLAVSQNALPGLEPLPRRTSQALAAARSRRELCSSRLAAGLQVMGCHGLPFNSRGHAARLES